MSRMGQESKFSLTETRSGVLRRHDVSCRHVVPPTSAWFGGFSQVLFTDLVPAKQIYQSNYLSLVTLEEAGTHLFMQGREPSPAST